MPLPRPPAPKREKGWCIWRERKRNRVAFTVRLGKRIFGRQVERWFTTRAAGERWIATALTALVQLYLVTYTIMSGFQSLRSERSEAHTFSR